MMVMQADYVTEELIEKAKKEILGKKDVPGLSDLRFSAFEEGNTAQILHVGPYNEVEKSIDRIETALQENGFSPAGKHHEIYLNDPRRVIPDKLKTIVRWPYK